LKSTAFAVSWNLLLVLSGENVGTTLLVRDEELSGSAIQEFKLELPAETVDVRELIRSRVFQEVKDFNARQSSRFNGLVQPTDTERELNGYRIKKGRKIDWQTQFEKAVEAFESNQILVLLNKQQLTDLDQKVEITSDSVLTFLKLTNLRVMAKKKKSKAAGARNQKTKKATKKKTKVAKSKSKVAKKTKKKAVKKKKTAKKKAAAKKAPSKTVVSSKPVKPRALLKRFLSEAAEKAKTVKNPASLKLNDIPSLLLGGLTGEMGYSINHPWCCFVAKTFCLATNTQSILLDG